MNQPSLLDTWLRQQTDATHNSKERGEREAAALRARLDSGEHDPDLYLQLSKLVDFESSLAVLREGYRRVSSRTLHNKLIYLLTNANRTHEAIDEARIAGSLFPQDLLFRIKDELALPVIYDDPGELRKWRGRFTQGIDRLLADLRLDTDDRRQRALYAVARHVNFYLCYQGLDDRELQSKYAQLVHRILAASHPEWMKAPEPGPACERLRVGYASAHFWRHAVSRAFSGWILDHDTSAFDVFTYQIGESARPPIEGIEQTSVFRHLEGSLAGQVEAIRSNRLHAMIFLDVGMSPRMTLLSSLRLAPLQCATWGHPVTTGSPQVDYYLSSDLMEPPDAQAHYSESLVRLPGLAVSYRKPVVPKALLDVRRSRFGIREDAVAYLCCQSTFKYLPQYDRLFTEIVRQVENAQLVFRAMPPIVEGAFRERLARAFASESLDFSRHCVFAPSMDLFDNLAFNLVCDVFLDSLEFSGYTTTIDALACGLPVVTMPGSFMRGRQSAALLREIGVPDTIGRNVNEYVDIAVRLGRDSELREQISERISKGYSALSLEPTGLSALEHFLNETARR